MTRLIAFLLISLPVLSYASDVEISQIEYIKSDKPEFKRQLQFTISWNNAWHNNRNHDAVWVFFKITRKTGGYQHVILNPNSEKQLWKKEGVVDAGMTVSEDGTGMMIYPGTNYRGDLMYRIQVGLDTARINERYINYFNGTSLEGYAIEMVQIPAGGFTLGDPDTTALDFGSFYRSDDSGNFDGLYMVESEDAPIEVGMSAGSLYYRAAEPEYQGDQNGPIPAAFPKGVDPFYIMKYEVNQGQYAAFLNSLGGHGASVRYTGGTPQYYEKGGTIYLKGDKFYAKIPDQRMVYWHWEDMMAFTDWAALRPYTELEYTKACRGPGDPIPHEMAWNTSDFDQLLRRINNESHRMELPAGMDESMLSDANRAQFGASYYWVMDLSGSMWEKLITIGDPTGRAFTGTHGDGNISYYGLANVVDWPKGYAEVEGYGYRGGGYYGRPDVSDFNPYSPIAYRMYGAWSGGARNAAYGYRAARTME